MAQLPSSAVNGQPSVYGTFDNSNGVGYLAQPVLPAGVDFTRLRSFLPRKAKGCDCGLSASLTPPLELKNFARSTPCKAIEDAPYSSSVPTNSTVVTQDNYSPESRNSSGPDTPQSVASDTDNFLAESESLFAILFAFIERNIESIEFQLDKKCDCVIVPLDHYATMTQSVSSGKKKELSKDDLERSAHFCGRTLSRVRQLKDCLIVNLTQLYSILDTYDRAFPEDRHLTANFKASKRAPISKLTGQLEECQTNVQEHKKYLEARLSVVGWKELLDPRHKRFTFIALLHFIVFLLSMAALAWYAGDRDRLIGLFYLYRGPMFITLYFYLYSLNLVGWASANIRYIDIFGFSSDKETPTPYVTFNIAGILSLMFAIFVALLMFTVRFENSDREKSETESAEIPERILPLVLWILTAVVLLNPFKWLIRKGRWKVLKVVMKILLAPFYTVRFGDFWLADQLNSIVVILLDLEFMFCFYSYVWPFDKHEDGKACNKNTYFVRPIISCLPAFWRLMQCLRCYYDTKRYPHLINAGKYFTTFPVVIFFALYSVDHESQSPTEDLKDVDKTEQVYLLAWGISSFIHAMYTFIWDVYMDWGLFQSSNLLRPNLGYSWKSFYYLAIVEDLILRFAWSLKLSLGLHLQAQVNLFYTVLAGLEIFRRFVWNFYRIEYEHIKITQLPSDEQSEDDFISDEKKSLLQHSINFTVNSGW